MRVLVQPLGPAQANCYIVADEGRALLIDPGDSFPPLKQILDRLHCKLEAVLLTHAHFDHIAGLDAIIKEFGVDVYMNPTEMDYLADEYKNGASSFGMSFASHAKPLPIKEGGNRIGGFDVRAWILPGHTEGSTVYEIGDCLFTGDVLFQGSIGRTDLPGGDDQAMLKSLRTLMKLPDRLTVYPGHGPSTTMGQEKRYNPYLSYLI